MNKYAMSKLDRSMVFDDDFIVQKIEELLPHSKLTRTDDFEFEIALKATEYADENNCRDIVRKIMQICSMSFWADNRFKIQEPEQILLKQKIVPWQPLELGVFIISSSATEISLELFLYQQRGLLYSVILTSKYELQTIIK
jgi:hypothetical protein